ncbi:ABC transporter ATP-binding protein [Nocardioides sp.]|uniref:ABC transporter ATP-binding protein n=1 Tax=Nocardioides sp. TaxID=35761 RepID=UPI002614A5D4|nr:ABC transporter ATP-binding protein [Nocardioides sp.]
MLSLEDVSISYDGTPAVLGASLEVPDGSVVAVLGPSGCGKSTLLRAVAGLERPVSGRIGWDGADLAGVPTHKRGFALMFQDGQLFTHLTVARNVGYALRLRRVPDVAQRVERLLALVGLEGYGARLPGTLSGGERQRVALARSLAAEPRLLLLDEPLSALDAGLRERLAGDLHDILREAGTTTLVVTHDQEEAFALADRLVVMRDGRIVQQGDIADVWARPVDAQTALFLGYARVLEGAAAARVLAVVGLDGGAVALRRSALTVDSEGPAGGGPRSDLGGTVRTVRATPDAIRVVVAVPGIGEVDALASPAARTAVGEQVSLGVDASRLAVLGRS